jgi:hypothetical protein
MKLQVGDKVRFLNEAIEGVVSGLQSNSRVDVSTADGFTMTAFENQLVKVEFEISLSHTQVMQPEVKDPSQTGVREMEDADTAKEKKKKPDPLLNSLKPDETIYAAVVLTDELSPLTTDVEILFLNNSSWSFAFTWNKRINDDLELVTADVLPSRSEKTIGLFSQDELHQFDGFLIRMFFFKSGIYQPRPAFEKTLRIESSRFLDSHYWEKAEGSGNRILLMPLKQMDGNPELTLDKLMGKFAPPDNGKLKKDKPVSRQEKIKPTTKYVVLSKEKVVDLHIEELLKDFSGMNNAQIISYQIQFFQNEMDRAIVNKLHKITFIHGVGQGVLKSAIREELKKYDAVTYGDGPPEKFGYGATEVMFK